MQEEDRRTQNNLVIIGLGEFSNDEVSSFIFSETGITPQMVSKRGDKVVIGISSNDDKEKIFQVLDRERLVGGGVISVKKEANTISASDIDGLMRRWLTVEDKARLRDGLAFPANQGTPKPHFQREVVVHGEPEDAMVQMVKSTQTNPKQEPQDEKRGKGAKGGRGRGHPPPPEPKAPAPISTPTPAHPSPASTSSFINPPQALPAQPQVPTGYPHPQMQMHVGPFQPPQLFPVQTAQWYQLMGDVYPPPYLGSKGVPLGKGGKGEKGAYNGKGMKGGRGGY